MSGEQPVLGVLAGSILVLGTGVVFSFGGLAFRLTDDITAWQYVIFRGLGALIATVVLLSFRHRGALMTLAQGVEPSHVVAGVILGGISTVFIVALEYASVAFVLFLQALAPLTGAYFSWLMLGERVTKAALIATGVSIAGVAVMVSATLTDAIEPLGTIAVLIPIFFGLYATLIRRAGRIEVQVPVLIGAVTLIAAGSIGAAFTGGFDVSVHDALIGMFAGSALLAIPVSLMNLGARVVPAPEVSLLLMSEVVLAPIWVWLFVDEEPEPTTIIGGAVIVGAVAGLLMWRRQQQLRLRLGRLPG